MMHVFNPIENLVTFHNHKKYINVWNFKVRFGTKFYQSIAKIISRVMIRELPPPEATMEGMYKPLP